MNARYALAAVIMAAALFASPLAASCADADDKRIADFERYRYYEQLSGGAKAVYDALCTLDPTVAPVEYGGSALYPGIYTVDVGMAYTVAAADRTEARGLIESRLKEDCTRAWQATKLDMPVEAVWTWSNTNAVPVALANSDIRDLGNGHYGIGSFTVNVPVSLEYYYGSDQNDMPAKYRAVKDAIAAVKIAGDTTAEKVDSINSWLCGDGIKYDPAVSNPDGNKEKNPFDWSVYGAFVHEVDGKHLIVCDGYSAAFKALCDRENIPCKIVFGLAAQISSAELHAWNLVIINEKVYAVDSTWNSNIGEKAYLAVGSQTVVDGQTFLQTHQAFQVYGDPAGQYDFYVPEMEYMPVNGYKWPAENGFAMQIGEYAPWIIIGLISMLLAYVLWSMGRKGE